MSYILDALKKSEAERDSAKPKKLEMPEVRTAELGTVTLSNTAGVSKFFKYLLIIVIALFSALIIYKVLEKKEPIQYQQRQPLNVFEPSDIQAAMPATTLQLAKNPAEAKIISNTEAPKNLAVINNAERKNTDPKNSISNIETDIRAPFNALERIPTLKITGHTYSPVRATRKVVMNNKEWREGDLVVEGVTLQEITKGGIILDVSGWPVVIGRSKGWEAIKGDG